jgi:enoyl-CoA hydratase/carnithine racemase
MDIDGLLRFTRMTGDLVRAMRACPQPIIAAVEGVCAGAGAIMAMASDIRFGQPGCKTAFLFSRVGLSGADMGACAILPRIIGHGRAAELLYTGRSMTSDEGLAWGFYNRVVEDVDAEAYALAGEIAKGPTIAHAVTKKQLDAEWNMSIEEALEAEAQAQARCMQTNDFKRAYEAFAAKRTPEFQGD